MSVLEIVLTFYGVANIFVGIFCGLGIVLGETTFNDEKLMFSPRDFFGCVFMYQKFIWDNSNGLVLFGRILLITISSLFVVCLNVLIFVILCLYFVGFLVIACFNYIFGKEHKWYFIKELKKEWEEQEKMRMDIERMRYMCLFRNSYSPKNDKEEEQ